MRIAAMANTLFKMLRFGRLIAGIHIYKIY
jgi:hypothetical protein